MLGMILAGSVLVPAAATASPLVGMTATAATTPEDDAVSRAHLTGEDVVVPGSVTETTQVLAQPEGGFRLETHPRPVRVERDGDWLPIDTGLQPGQDGRLRPAAGAADVSFSPGGTVPLVVLRDDDEHHVAVSWPAPLPAPTVTDNTATYPEVLPGVDLTVAADSLGFSEVLVVKTADAAANPALQDIRLHASTEGVDLGRTDTGGLAATDGAETVFGGSTPVMWDSSGSEPPSAQDTGSGRVTLLPITTAETGPSTTDVILAPPTAALTGPGVVYPVYIDPSMADTSDSWLQVTTAGWTHFNTGDNAGVGYCHVSLAGCGSSFRARSFFLMDISPLMKRGGKEPVVFRADFFATQVHGASGCTAQPVDLFVTGAFGSGTTWPGPGADFLERQWSGVGDQCSAPGEVKFNAAQAVRKWFDNNGSNPNASPTLAFGLRSQDENNSQQWKRFGNNPRFEAVFNFVPEKPTDLTIVNKITCTGRAVTAESRPVLSARAHDNNAAPLPIGLWFNIHRPDSTVVASTAAAVETGSDVTTTWQPPAAQAQPDGDYGMQAMSENHFPGNPAYNLNAGLALTAFPFSIHAAKPVKPTLSTTDYPSDYWGSPADAPGTFTVDSNSSPHVVGFSYTFQQPGTEVVPAATDCDYNRSFGGSSPTGGWVPAVNGKAVIPIPAGMSVGYHTLNVKTFTDAHVMSDSSDTYKFYVPAATGSATATGQAETLAPAQPGGQAVPLATQGDCCNVRWAAAAQLRFQGNAVNQSFTLDVPISTEGNYRLDLRTTMAADYGQVAFTLDGSPIGTTFDAFSPVVLSPTITIGTRQLTVGTHKLGLKAVGTNPATVGTRYQIGADQLVITHVTQRVEAELLTREHPVGQAVTSAVQGTCCGATFSGGAHVWFPATAADQATSLRFTVPSEGDYAMAAGITKGSDHGRYRIDIDGAPLNRTEQEPRDSYAATGTTRPPGHQPLGGAHLIAGQHVLTFTAVGQNPASSGFALGIDYIDAVKLYGTTTQTFASALNNRAVTPVGAAGEFDLNGGSLPREAMQAAGLSSGGAITVNGVTFTLPAYAGGGLDNVVATGQTIPLSGATTSEIGFLVASTCGATPLTRAYLTYTDQTHEDRLFPSVPDWISGDRDSAVVELPYSYRNGAATLSLKPKLYTVFLPVGQSTKPLASISLPHYGFQQGTGCPPSLHVLGMALRTDQIHTSGPGSPAWVGTWAAPADAAVLPPDGAGLAGKTIRVVARPSVRGTTARVRLSNQFGQTPLVMTAASVAVSGTGSSSGTPVSLTFQSSTSVTIPPGGTAVSDPVANPTASTGDLVVSAYFATAVGRLTTHKSATARTYLAAGNRVAAGDWSTYSPQELPDTYLVAGIDVTDQDTAHGTVVVLGDQTTAVGALSGGQRSTWVDAFPASLDSGLLQGGLVNASQTGLTPTARWPLAHTSGTTATDVAGNSPASLTGTAGAVSYTNDATRGQVATFNGGGVLATAKPVVDTRGDYSVTAWARLTANDTYYTVASQGAGNMGSFYLQYSKGLNAWAFVSPNIDSTGATSYPAVTGPVPTLNTWTHLAGTFDSRTGVMSLYVNGTLTGTVVNPTPFAANGPFTVGGVKLAGGAISNQFKGSVSDARVFERVLTAQDVLEVKAGGRLSDGPTARSAAQTSARTVFANPNVRSVVVSLGANDLMRATGSATAIADAVKQDLATLIGDTTTNGLRARVRADGSNVRVFLATIPPLGLPASDPREQARISLNSDMLANYSQYGQPTQVFDMSAAVEASPGSSLVNAAYQTDGQPNASYHQQVATTFAAVINGPPPYDDF